MAKKILSREKLDPSSPVFTGIKHAEEISLQLFIFNVIVSAHEDYNTNVLKGITSVQYYEAFNEKFVVVNEIMTMIEYMSQFLPSNIHEEFYEIINSHLKEKNKVGDLVAERTCEFCKQKKQDYLSVLSSRIKESDILKERIEDLIK